MQVPFRRCARIGIVLGIRNRSEISPERLKEVLKVLDTEPILPEDTVELLKWSSEYYHHPIGEVFHGILPNQLRQGRSALVRGKCCWQLTEVGTGVLSKDLRRTPRQAAVLLALQSNPSGLTEDDWPAKDSHWRRTLKGLENKGWVKRIELDQGRPPGAAKTKWQPEPAQEAVVHTIHSVCNQFHTFLLEGITGSGKTTVYLELIGRTVSKGRQALLLIPEIGLTPQMLARFREQLDASVLVLHSGLGDQERLRAWVMAREGRVSVIVGTRSAAFVPLKHPGIFIVDEEHDVSYKQQDGFRYSARDVVVVRGRQSGVPVVLGSATPSLESLHNVIQGRYRHLLLPKRAAGAAEPSIEVIDIRGRVFDSGLSDALLQAIQGCLVRCEQSLLFLNRRGYAPLLVCHSCGWIAGCERCDARLVYHRIGESLRCHHCGAERQVPSSCPACQLGELRVLGTGTQRVVQALARHFPHARVGRVDRDLGTHKGALQATLAGINEGEIDILVGTQMLTKGHHFPNVTLVGILDADGGLFGADFRASERMGQLIVQVAGRAGRGERPGRVLIQTHHPNHPLLRILLSQGYRRFAEAVLAERREAKLPPHAALALVQAEATVREKGLVFLTEAKQRADSKLDSDVSVLGPVPAPMERRGGRYRAHLLVHAECRRSLHHLLHSWIPELVTLKSRQHVRWSVDVDPQVMI